ncbi:SDR family NAD(P)-dependent oxidoreductase [Ktedonobacter racemifer]|uniref:Short-chain dehydrogenase/reductase SDR n=1 Tax=Ktedonobacter racemifer DSM 44963 TaxID=485913 RepID=D6U8G7_KTERA|nr:SDR family oxidoreductase [Ktedonobacter racemifer]EFH80178.1 short-chain dehydrogenase/reductase SDR [Ktedonobacter racemifer DSM 44963]
MLLKNKNAVIYGAGGAIGGAVARAFAREGAKVFLAGRSLSSLEAVAKDISHAGGVAEVAQVDALDERAVENYLKEVARKAGSIDVSFNVIGLGDTQGAPLVEMEHERFALPIVNAMATHFLTATAAARHMRKNGSGVILALTAQAARSPYPNVGGFGVAGAAIEGFCRQLAAEVGPQGIRVICLRSAGSPDTPGVDEVFHRHAKDAGISREAFEAGIAEKTLLKRLPKLAEVANVAALMASDYASAVTGAVANVTCGEIVD